MRVGRLGVVHVVHLADPRDQADPVRIRPEGGQSRGHRGRPGAVGAGQRGGGQGVRDVVRRGLKVSDEAMAMELAGFAPLLVEGAEDNIKVTTAADFALAEFLLTRTA